MKTYFLTFLLLFAVNAMAQVPKLYSDNGSAAVVFLDFDGHRVQSVVWNNGNPIDCAPSTSVFTAAQITEVFNRVAEDYRLFKINITTDSLKFLAAVTNQRMRIIITPTNYWFPGVGGVSYMNSFSWGDNTPGFVFTGATPTTKFAAEAASHETGHTLGLAHQSIYDNNCNMLAEYNAGSGSGLSEVSWAPIMGYSVDRIFSTWNYGQSSIDCSIMQDDISTIASKITGGGLRSDDVLNTYTSATLFTVSGNSISASGIVNNAADVDVFRLNLTQSKQVLLKALPPQANNNQNYGNIDIQLKLMNASGVVINAYNVTDSLRAGIDTTLAAGTWYVSVDGVGNVNSPGDYGSTGSYTLSGTLAAAGSLPIYRLDLSGSVNNDQHVLSWRLEADEPIKRSEIQYSYNGADFSTLQQVDHRNGNYAWRPFSSGNTYYRMRAWLRDGSYKTSNIISLQTGRGAAGVQLLSSKASDVLLVGSKENYRYEIYDMGGRLIQKGLLNTGVNRVTVDQQQPGIYIFKAFNESSAITERFIKS
jgi:hypothetical protein